MRHDHTQDRWNNPEEEYYLAKHGPEAAGQGSDSNAAMQAGSKARRMHPFGQGIRYFPDDVAALYRTQQLQPKCCSGISFQEKQLSSSDAGCSYASHMKCSTLYVHHV